MAMGQGPRYYALRTRQIDGLEPHPKSTGPENIGLERTYFRVFGRAPFRGARLQPSKTTRKFADERWRRTGLREAMAGRTDLSYNLLCAITH